MFQKSLKAATGKNKSKKKIVIPKLKVCTIADLYTLFVLVENFPSEDFWNLDIRFLDLTYANKKSWDSYLNNPKVR